MFDIVVSIYNGIFMVLFAALNFIILFHFFTKLRNLLSDSDEVKSGYVLVTGCDIGFGYAAAIELNKRNIFVFAGCLTAESVEKFKQNKDFKGMAFIMDISKKEDIINARQIAEAKVGEDGLWCLINNAGVCKSGLIDWLSEEDMRRTMDVNLWGAVNTTKAMIPLIKRARGRIVNTTSIAGRVSGANLAAYSMTKYALEAFSDSLRLEMKPWGISVHIIEPGFHATDLFLKHNWAETWESLPQTVREEYGDRYFHEMVDLIKSNAAMMLDDPQNVVKAYLHAALSSRPKLRYVVGRDAQTVFMAIATLPTAIGDMVRCKLSKMPIPAAMKRKSMT